MIDHLKLSRSAHFYASAKPFTDNAVDDLFDELHASFADAGDYLFRQVRRERDGRTYSAICFPYGRSPAFLRGEAGVLDVIHGYVLIVEHGDLVAVLKSGLELSAAFREEWLRAIGSAGVERAVAKADAKFESVRMRSMSTSRRTIRSKTLEADDLENSIPMSSTGRFVSQRFRVRRGSVRYTATPITGRIAQSGDRLGHAATVDWAVAVMAELARDRDEVAPFIRNFARPMDVASLPAAIAPVTLAIDLAELGDRLRGDESVVRLTRKSRAGEYRELLAAERDGLLETLDRDFALAGPRDALRILDGPQGAEVGRLHWGKTRLGLSRFDPPEARNVYVVDGEQGPDGERHVALKAYIDREDLFIVLFDDVSIAYLHGELFRDDTMRDGGASFLSHLIADACLSDASSEKGRFRKDQKKFAPNSVFGKLERQIAGGDDVLICDDLGDEWADFIGLNTVGRPPSITFYHAKHGKLSLGASAFHVSVSQAEKNLGRLPLPQDALDAKFDGWEAKPYENAKTKTLISRLIRGGPRANVERQLAQLRSSADLVRRVTIVTSSLSVDAVAQAFASIRDGRRPTAHFVQLYWLLTSFFSACAEVGAIGYVICRP